MKKTRETDMEEKEIKNDADNITVENAANTENSAAANEETVNKSGEDIEALKKQYETTIGEWKDKYLRLSAEFDNFRKRTLKEKIELSKYANEEVLKGLLTITDDFEHGLKNLEGATDMNAIVEGLHLIYNKFKDFLAQKGLKEIEALNAEFNTDYHEAVSKFPVEDKEKSGKIIDVLQKGYMLDDKVVRHSKVVVGE
jgi:molecular chaperone GrpE